MGKVPANAWLKILDEARRAQSDICSAKEHIEKMESAADAVAGEDGSKNTELAEAYIKLKEHLQFAERLAAEIGDQAVKETGCSNPYLL